MFSIYETYFEIILFIISIIITFYLFIKDNIICKVIWILLTTLLILLMIYFNFRKKKRVNYKQYSIFYY